MRAPPPVGSSPQENADWRRDKQAARDTMKNALAVGLTAAGPSPGSAMPSGVPQNALAIGQPPGAPSPPPVSPLPPALPQPAPAATPDAALNQAVQVLATGSHSDADLAEHANLHGAAMGHLGKLLAKGSAITRQDAVQGVLDAAQAGTITNQQATGLVDKMQGSPQQIQAAVRGLMAQAALGAVATAAAQQRRTSGAGAQPVLPAAGASA